MAAGAVLVAVALAWQVWQVVPGGSRAHRTAQVQGRLDAAYASSSAEEASQREGLMTALEPVLGRPAFSSRQVLCDVGNWYDDHELIASNWSETCTLRSLDVYAWESRGDDVRSRLRAASKGALSGEDDDYPVDACGELLRAGAHGNSRTVVQVGRVVAGRWTVADYSGPPCVLPAPVVPYSDSVVLAAFDVAQVDRDRTWIYIVRSRDFYSDGLGCAGFLCLSPINGVPLPRV